MYRMKVKAKDIAKELGISPATVSLVLNLSLIHILFLCFSAFCQCSCLPGLSCSHPAYERYLPERSTSCLTEPLFFPDRGENFL